MVTNKEIVDREIGNRLAKLRTEVNPKLTQDKLYAALRDLISKREGTINDDDGNQNGDKVISKIENGYGLSLRYALAYSEYFNVSLEYIYFGAKSYKPSYDDIKELTGLSDDALHTLEMLKKNDKTSLFVLNKFLGLKMSNTFITLLHSFFDYLKITAKRKDISNEYIKYAKKRGIKIKISDDFSWELYPKEREYISLYKISTETKELAEEFKKCGDKNEI